jgi:hypothetical protein
MIDKRTSFAEQRGGEGVAAFAGGAARCRRVSSGVIFSQFVAGRGNNPGVGSAKAGARRRHLFAVGTVAAPGPHRNLTRAGCGYVTKIRARNKARCPSACAARRDGKQEAPPSPVAVFNLNQTP